MSNPHYDEAKANIQATDGMRLDKATFYVALAQTEATLALAYEQRTANLLTQLDGLIQEGVKGQDVIELELDILTRLGLGDTK